MTAKELLILLENSTVVHFMDELYFTLKNSCVIIYADFTMPRQHVYKVYKKRADTNNSIINNYESIIGYDDMLKSIKSIDIDEIKILKVVTENCGYTLFFNEEILSILKSLNINIRKSEELKTYYKAQGLTDSGVYYCQTVPVV